MHKLDLAYSDFARVLHSAGVQTSQAHAWFREHYSARLRVNELTSMTFVTVTFQDPRRATEFVLKYG